MPIKGMPYHVNFLFPAKCQVNLYSFQCQDTLVQFGSFLACNLSSDDYTRRLPPLHELLTRYHVNSDLAFFLARPMFNHQISLKVTCNIMIEIENILINSKTFLNRQLHTFTFLV